MMSLRSMKQLACTPSGIKQDQIDWTGVKQKAFVALRGLSGELLEREVMGVPLVRSDANGVTFPLLAQRKDCNGDVGNNGEPTNSMDFVHHPLASGRCMMGSGQDLFDCSMAGQTVETGVHCQCSGISCNLGECKVRSGIRLQVDRNAIHEDFNRSSGGVKVNDVSFEEGFYYK